MDTIPTLDLLSSLSDMVPNNDGFVCVCVCVWGGGGLIASEALQP